MIVYYNLKIFVLIFVLLFSAVFASCENIDENINQIWAETDQSIYPGKYKIITTKTDFEIDSSHNRFYENAEKISEFDDEFFNENVLLCFYLFE